MLLVGAAFGLCAEPVRAELNNGWAAGDLRLNEEMGAMEAQLLSCGGIIRDFSQGRIYQREALKRVNSVLEAAQASFSKISRLDRSADVNLYACGIDTARKQLQQIKAAKVLLEKPEVLNKDILTLQAANAGLYKAQSRYMKARLQSVKAFLEKRRGQSFNQKPNASDEAVKAYYRFQTELLPLQIEELQYSESLMNILRMLVEGRTSPAGDLLHKCRSLEKRLSGCEAEGELKPLKESCRQEFADFARFAEAVLLLGGDLSVDSVSRLNRWNAKLQKDSEAARECGSAIISRYLR